jgi:hypothetical protein
MGHGISLWHGSVKMELSCGHGKVTTRPSALFTNVSDPLTLDEGQSKYYDMRRLIHITNTLAPSEDHLDPSSLFLTPYTSQIGIIDIPIQHYPFVRLAGLQFTPRLKVRKFLSPPKSYRTGR